MIACHADHVGSLLRPSDLIAARAAAAAGRISRTEFQAIEDRAVEDVIRLQERVGLPVITDSEQRSRAAYPTLESFLADVVDILREEVAELVRLGATYIQLDAPHYALLLDPATRTFYESQGGHGLPPLAPTAADAAAASH